MISRYFKNKCMFNSFNEQKKRFFNHILQLTLNVLLKSFVKKYLKYLISYKCMEKLKSREASESTDYLKPLLIKAGTMTSSLELPKHKNISSLTIIFIQLQMYNHFLIDLLIMNSHQFKI